MAVQGEISFQTTENLRRPVLGQVHFSDVFPEVDGSDTWWRKTDFDAGLTVAVESSGFPTMEQIPIGLRPWLANYGLVLVDDLLQSQNERAGKVCHSSHADLRSESQQNKGAILAVANYAPRNDEHIEHGSNGSDFYLAITDSGLEIYTTPLEFLSNLDARHRIVSLYRIPTAGHPEFNGEHEQFRSARIARTRRHHNHLESIFEYPNREELIRSKEAGSHAGAIPVDTRLGKIAFVDKFGNTKLDIGGGRRLLAISKFATLVIINGGKEYEIPVYPTEDLRSAPLGKLAIYANCSDRDDSASQSRFVELAARVNGNPSKSSETAYFQLLEKIPDLDPASAEIMLNV